MGECNALYTTRMTPRLRLTIGCTIGLALICAASVVGGQEPAPGQITVAVTDADRGVIPGASITLDGRRLQAPRTATSDPFGIAAFPDVAPGSYLLRVQLRGFRTMTWENVVVEAGGRTKTTITLAILGTHGVGLEGIVPAGYREAIATMKAGEVGVALDVYGGQILLAVDTAHAPITSANFLKYVDGGFYDLGRFHRVTRPDNYTPLLPNRPPMQIIQAGRDPFRFRDGFDPIPLERTSVTGIKHVRGALSMARGGPDTATSDFVILLDDQPSLDFGGMRFDDGQGGAAFGRVIFGLDVAERINKSGPLRPAPSQQYLQIPEPIVKAYRIKK